MNDKPDAAEDARSDTPLQSVEAAALDAKVANILREAQTRVSAAPLATGESIRAGKAAMNLGREKAARVLLERIARHELITGDTLATRLHVTNEWIANALADHRLFYFLGPNDVKYYPAFFASADIDHQALEHVTAKLGHVPGPAKYQFFFTRSTLLRSKTPLEALRADRLANVLIAADGYANS